MWWSDYWPMPWMFFGPVMMLVFFFLCLAILGMMRSSRGGYVIEILEERYARGEINKVEFEERRRLLQA
jgi:putative membrane protein